MAMTKCYECRKEISTLADKCPHCGAPQTAEAKKEQLRKMLQKEVPPSRQAHPQKEEVEKKEKEKKTLNKGCQGCFVVIFLFVIVLIIIAIYYSRNGSGSKEQSGKQRTTPVETLMATENGYAWRKASHEVKLSLCKDLAIRSGKHDSNYYYQGLESFYKTDQEEILKRQIAEVAAALALMGINE